MTTPAEDGTGKEFDERATGRLFGLSDAVFAIAMTLLALDLRVPEIPDHAGDPALVRALLDQEPRYVSFLLSFYVIAGYWRRHHAEMRTVHATHPALLRRTMVLLLWVTCLPFAAELLGTYGGTYGIAIAVYAGINVLALASLLQIRREARNHRLFADSGPTSDSAKLWFDLVALVLAIPCGYLFAPHGTLVMVVLLVISGVAGSQVARLRAQRSGSAPARED